MNLPNGLTLIRILLVPVFVALLFVRYEEHALAVFLVATFTDWLDGWLARRRNQVTTLGALLDPLADKLLICSAFISLGHIRPDDVQPWMVVIIVSRELAVTGIRNIAAMQGVAIPASNLGKLKMAGQALTVVLLIFGRDRLGWLSGFVPVLLWLTVVVAFVSMFQYAFNFAKKGDFSGDV